MNSFLSCDWGTSRFRIRLVGPDRRVLAEHQCHDGIQSIAAAHPAGPARERALRDVLHAGIAAVGADARTEVPVAISGMASSNLGWKLLPYAPLPAPIDGSTLGFQDLEIGGRQVRLISGLRDKSDVMRGEETELVGIFASPSRRALANECVAILPGTHSKHVLLRDARIVGFGTHLTGELYGLLCRHSTVRPPDDAAFEASAFLQGVRSAGDLGVTAAIFQTRARSVLGQLPPKASGGFLSGVLIGAELQGLLQEKPGRIVLAAGEALVEPYRLALAEVLPRSTVIGIPPGELAQATIAAHALILAAK